MKPTSSQILIAFLTMLLIAGVAWLWFDNMEKRWVRHGNFSEAAGDNPMLAASRFLQEQGHPVTVENTLGVVLFKPLPRGTLILAENAGVMTKSQVSRLLAWVAEGNTLVTSPMWEHQKKPVTPASGAAVPGHLEDTDSLDRHFGVIQRPFEDDGAGNVCRPENTDSKNDEKSSVAPIKHAVSITLPDAAYPLRLHVPDNLLDSDGTAPMLFGGDEGQAVRAFAQGKGRVVFVARNYFNNINLPFFDHAELLLGLANLNHDARSVLIVQRLDIVTWYQALWAMLPYAILCLVVFLLLLAWMVGRRFGPLLPEPDITRRAWMEHVDASGRWLWKSEKGRLILLTAVREATEKILARRVGELSKLPFDQKIQTLALQCKLNIADLATALQGPVAQLPAEFTSQIQTLQRLRNHYEHNGRSER